MHVKISPLWTCLFLLLTLWSFPQRQGHGHPCTRVPFRMQLKVKRVFYSGEDAAGGCVVFPERALRHFILRTLPTPASSSPSSIASARTTHGFGNTAPGSPGKSRPGVPPTHSPRACFAAQGPDPLSTEVLSIPFVFQVGRRTLPSNSIFPGIQISQSIQQRGQGPPVGPGDSFS